MIKNKISKIGLGVVILTALGIGSGQADANSEYVLNNSVKAYNTANDAAQNKASKLTYSQGKYYIFKEYKGMINISKIKGKAGAWINPSSNTKNTKVVKEETKKINPQTTKSPSYIKGILLVNKKHPLPQTHNPGENVEARLNINKLIQDARNQKMNISTSTSGFRSYAKQESLYKSYVARSGQKAADTYSARPGYSEHQTGLAFDLLHNNGQLVTGKKESDWIANNAHKYGFIVRYKKGWEKITGYQGEPWHLRYVGKKVAEELYKKNIPLETYLSAEGGDYRK